MKTHFNQSKYMVAASEGHGEVAEQREALGDEGLGVESAVALAVHEDLARRLLAPVLVRFTARIYQFYDATRELDHDIKKKKRGGKYSNFGVATILEPSLKMTPTLPLQSK